jgi:hypothetical protein
MAILHLQPGDIVPRTGVYALIVHPGDRTTYSLWRDKGERIPPVAAGRDNPGSVWFVLVHDASRNSTLR